MESILPHRKILTSGPLSSKHQDSIGTSWVVGTTRLTRLSWNILNLKEGTLCIFASLLVSHCFDDFGHDFLFTKDRLDLRKMGWNSDRF